MKLKLLLCSALLLEVGGSAQAQTSFYTNQATQAVSIVGSPQPVQGPIPFAGVRVCNLPLTQSAPCLPLATITDQFGNALSNSIGSNFGQFQADSFGRFTFGCTTGANLQLQWAGASNTPQGNIPITCPGSGVQAGGNNIFSGNNTFGPGSLTVSGTQTNTGPLYTENSANPVYVCNATYACTDVGLQAAVTALTGGGTVVIPAGNGLTIANTVNVANPNITIMGLGAASSIQINNTGDVFNVTGSRFHLQDMEIAVATTTARTGAVVHASTNGAVLGYVSNLDIIGNVTSTNNGHFFLADASTGNIVQWNFRDIRMPRGTTWTTAFKFVDSSNANTSSTFRILGYVGGASFTDAGIVVDGAIDTLQISQSQWNNDSGTGKGMHIRNTVAGFIDPRFVNVEQSAIEATDGGTHVSTAVQIDNGRLNEFINVQCANTTTCYTLGTSSGSVIDTNISQGKGITLQQNYVNIGANAVRTKIVGNRVSQASQQTDGGFSMVLAAANATDFDVIDNTYTCPNAGNRIHYGVEVAAGTGDRIKVIANNFSLVAAPFNCLFAAGTSIGASGVDIQVYGNAPINNTTPRMVLGTNPAQTASALDLASAFPLCWRNNANSADVCVTKNASDQVTMPTALVSTGTAVAFTGSTGACSTTGTQSGGSWAGRVTCTAATAASTLVIVPGTTAPNGWICSAFDQTTRANLLQQTATGTTSCTLTATSITQNDVIVFQATAF